MANPYEQLTNEAMADCAAGRYAEAENKLNQVLAVEKQCGVAPGGSKAMYWLLVARYKGDEKQAMREWCQM